MKKVILSLVTIGLFSTLNAEGLGSDFIKAGADVLKKKIEADKDVAIQKKATVEVENSTLIAEAEMNNENIVVGANGAIVAVSEEATIDNSDLIAKSKMNNENVVVGANGAIILGAH
jgi:sulfur carrier protein ThiS